MHLIIDADPIVYRAGFAAETHNYAVIAEHPDGSMEQLFFAKDEKQSAGDKKKAWQKEHPEAAIVDQEMVPDVEPVAFALRGVKMTIEACINDVAREVGKRPDVVSVLLSGPGNFRVELATIKPYKGNRDDAYKPTHYQAIRDYLCQNWNAEVIEGHEADDECSIRAWQDEGFVVVATIDKDLDQIPCLHYDYAKKVSYEVDEAEGKYLFWLQVITGDATDNIQGMYRVGQKSAEKILDAIYADYVEQTGAEIDADAFIWERIVGLYEENIDKYPDKYPEGMTAEEAALENARLVFMQQYRGQLWTPPGEPDEVTT